VEQSIPIDLGRAEARDDKDEDYYPQFAQALRSEAATMSKHYEVFYCLEVSIRRLIAETLEGAHGKAWWDTTVPQTVRDNAKANMQREIDSAVTLRSEHDIDYTTFGELGEIVRTNWASFDAIFSSQKAFTKIMTSLNMLRGPIAHCCPLAEDEIVRLRLAVKDWFRLME
jgi:methionine synthase II (cobalamin-independent)